MVATLRRDPLAVARYLRAALPAPEATLPALCRHGIEPDLVSTMLQSLAAETAASAPAAEPAAAATVVGASASSDYCLRFLRGLAGTGGWDLSASMLESADRDGALRLLRTAAAGLAAAPTSAAGALAPAQAATAEIAALAAAFRIPIERVHA
jgi:hypothetical protein